MVNRAPESEARYRSLIQGAAYGIYRTTMDGRILDANPAFAHMLGYENVEDVASLNMNDVYESPEERQALIDQYRRAKRQQAMSTDVKWRRKDGSSIMVHLTARLVDLDGTSCFEVMAEDITARRALEDQLRQAQKMEAVGRVARTVAHDFNNVLAAIVGGCDIVALNLDADHPARNDVEEIRKAAERGAALTRQLLAISRNETVDAQPLDLNAAISEMRGTLERLAGEQVTLHVCVDEAPTLVRIEPAQLEQVLMNLTANARDAMPEGGAIDIVVERVALDRRTVRFRYPAVEPGAYARISVRDTGSGIDPEAQRHLFEPFFTTKEPTKGSGLGLAIVYGIAKESGGTVAFLTSPRGTTFEVLLPLVDGSLG